MAIICRDHRLLFIMAPGTACSMLGGVLLDRFGGEWLPEDHVFRGGEQVVAKKHCSIADLLDHGVVNREQLQGLTSFVTIRNPFDRFVTAYERARGSWLEERVRAPDSYFNQGPEEYVERTKQKAERRIARARDLEFEEWLLRGLNLYPTRNPIEWGKQLRRRLRRRDPKQIVYPLIDGVDQIMRYETLEADFNGILRKAGIDEHVSLERPKGSTDRTPGKKPFREYYSPGLRSIIEKEFRKELSLFGYSFE